MINMWQFCIKLPHIDHIRLGIWALNREIMVIYSILLEVGGVEGQALCHIKDITVFTRSVKTKQFCFQPYLSSFDLSHHLAVSTNPQKKLPTAKRINLESNVGAW